MTNYSFSDFRNTSSLGFFEMTVFNENGNVVVVFNGGSKELINIEREIRSGTPIEKFKSYYA